MKKLVRKPGNPLDQLCNRLSEQDHNVEVKDSFESNHLFKAEHDTGPLIATCRGTQYKKVVQPKGIVLASDRRNSCCKLSDGSIVIVENFAHYTSGEPCIIGNKYLNLSELYSVPCSSAMLGIFVASQLSTSLQSWPLHSVTQKCIRTVLKTRIVIFPLLRALVHT
ncbi:hypothetical protein MRX96_035018 [Rhipicephalus microplus]